MWSITNKSCLVGAPSSSESLINNMVYLVQLSLF